MVLREVPNVWKYGPLPCCTQTLMSLSPAEATAAVQTHHPFKAYLVLSKKNAPRHYVNQNLCVYYGPPTILIPVSLLNTGPRDT